MANRVSSQSGNWNSTATWGGSAVPVDGDTVTVTAGTEVTISDTQVPTNGFGDVQCNGKLLISSGGTMRMNGVLYVNASGSDKHYVAGDTSSGGFFNMTAGSILEFKGTNSENHGLQLQSHQWVTIELEGSDTWCSATTVAGSAALTYIGGYSVQPAAGTGNFAVGDWCTIYRSQNASITSHNYNKSDEGFIVHDVAGGLIYMRHYVSPYTNITEAVSSTVLKVADASVFRFGQKIIFGTGSNRNTKEITVIDYNINTITVNSSTTGTVVGETIYRSGWDKSHITGDILQKIATPITATAASGQSDIVVASTAGFSVGDEVALPNTNIEYTGTWNFTQVYKITNISGNTITVGTATSAGSSYADSTLAQEYKSSNHNDVCFCANMSRDVVIRGIDASQYVYFYSVYWTSSNAYYRRLLIRNVQAYWMGGNSTSYLWGWYLRARWSYKLGSYGNYVSRMENTSIRLNGGNNPNGNTSNSRIQMSESTLYLSVRNNILCNSYYGIMNHSCYEYGLFNNISFWQGYAGIYISGWYNPRNQVAYNLCTRCEDYTWIWYHFRNASQVCYQNRNLCSHNRALYMYYNTNGAIIDTCYIDGYRYWSYAPAGGGNMLSHNSYWGNDWDVTGSSRVYSAGIQLQYDGNAYPYYGGGNKSIYHSVSHNFKHNGLAEWGSGIMCVRVWDEEENAWRYYNDYDWGNPTYGFSGSANMTYLPAGTKMMLRGKVKRIGTNTTAPYLEIRQQYDCYDIGQYQDYTTSGGTYAHDDPVTAAGGSDPISPISGWRKRSQFPAFTTSGYTEHTLTLDPLKQDSIVYCGIFWYSNSSMDPGWYEKPVKIFIDSRKGPYNNALCGHIGNSWTTPVQMLTRETPSTQVVRVGGRVQ